jgi:hypothetical protein
VYRSCGELQYGERVVYYSVFFDNDVYKGTRQSVIMEACEARCSRRRGAGEDWRRPLLASAGTTAIRRLAGQQAAPQAGFVDQVKAAIKVEGQEFGEQVYAGTTSLFFTVGNAIKAVPWLLLVRPSHNVWIVMAICLLAIPGVWLGWRLHARLDQRQIYRACYALLIVTALKLLWDGVSGYLG